LIALLRNAAMAVTNQRRTTETINPTFGDPQAVQRVSPSVPIHTKHKLRSSQIRPRYDNFLPFF